jgi:hypothetical protein
MTILTIKSNLNLSKLSGNKVNPAFPQAELENKKIIKALQCQKGGNPQRMII